MTHIHVKTNYGGRMTDERRILPGVYALDDARLFGAGQYLLDNGHAVAVADPQAVVMPPAPEPVEESIGFSVVEPEAVVGIEEVTDAEPVEGEQVGGFEDDEAPDELETPKGRRSK